jgi:hypothetical protein
VCKQREDIWRQRSGNAQTMIKKEAVIINCSEMRTEGTSRPSAGMFPPLHLCNSHHASSNQRITKSSEQRLNNNVIQRRREKYLAFESSCASPDAHRHQLSLKIGMLSLSPTSDRSCTDEGHFGMDGWNTQCKTVMRMFYLSSNSAKVSRAVDECSCSHCKSAICKVITFVFMATHDFPVRIFSLNDNLTLMTYVLCL